MAFVGKLTAEAKEAARANNIKALSDNIKLLTGKYQKGSIPVNSKEGKTLNTHEEQMKRLVEHFKNVLNQNPPVNKADIPPSEELLAVDYAIDEKLRDNQAGFRRNLSCAEQISSSNNHKSSIHHSILFFKAL
ncbi:Hypothetical predicted protein [Mytilus galloprovincialis]|uniref:Uncharacterized protein n=1 Tax=Mytilus galloprovincialis TaxID=29158 RepID=A0A8B6FF96_MYTGA|nr:Hypothetical predicted protein [Mytilus galloprovincialis]